MGGGDLNATKSWHVSNFHNVERVYLAEQKALAEKRKIAELMKERAESARIEELQAHAVAQGIKKKTQERVEFMYQGAAPIDREAYLLGKAIDKAVELDTKDDLNIGNAPGAAFVHGNANTALDLAKKVRDDPLFAIKKKEQEGVRNLLNNPVRLKQLQQLREAARGKDKKEKKSKKEKKEKKAKKEKKERRDKGERRSSRSRSRSSSPEGPSSRDDELRKMISAASSLLPAPRPDTDGGGGAHTHHARAASASSASVQGSSSAGGHHRHAHHGRARTRSRSPVRSRRSRSRSPVRSHRRSRSPHDRHKRARSRSSSPPPSDRHHRDRERPRDGPSTRHGPPHEGSARRSVAAVPSNDSRDREEERQRKLEEMRANASWHDEERAQRALEHAAREAEQAKKDAQRATDGRGQASFMSDFNRTAYDSAAAGSVGDRLARGRHYIQRTSAALDSQSFKRA